MKSFEPTPDQLTYIQSIVSVELVEFDRGLVRLKEGDFLPRYNRVRVRIRSTTTPPSATFYVTVRRHETSIGSENFYTVPIFCPELRTQCECVYDIYSFDSFNLPFEGLSVSMTGPEEYRLRRLAKAYIERAHELTSLISSERST
jgi:hypothetical protein